MTQLCATCSQVGHKLLLQRITTPSLNKRQACTAHSATTAYQSNLKHLQHTEKSSKGLRLYHSRPDCPQILGLVQTSRRLGEDFRQLGRHPATNLKFPTGSKHDREGSGGHSPLCAHTYGSDPSTSPTCIKWLAPCYRSRRCWAPPCRRSAPHPHAPRRWCAFLDPAAA